MNVPEIDSLWRHKNGDFYRVILIANKDSKRIDEYPVTVVYKRLCDETIWCRPFYRWLGSFENVTFLGD